MLSKMGFQYVKSYEEAIGDSYISKSSVFHGLNQQNSYRKPGKLFLDFEVELCSQNGGIFKEFKFYVSNAPQNGISVIETTRESK